MDVFTDRLAAELLPDLSDALVRDGNALNIHTFGAVAAIVDGLAAMMRRELAHDPDSALSVDESEA